MYTISRTIENLDIRPAGSLQGDCTDLDDYTYFLIDESHRIYESQFAKICESVIRNGHICIFSSDPDQVLSAAEKKRDIVSSIKSLCLSGEYTLSEKIRTNRELQEFISCLLNLHNHPRIHMSYQNIQLNYANTTAEAQILLLYYRSSGFKFINYSKSNYVESPYSVYPQDYDTHHVIGHEYDKVVMIMDDSFYYDENGRLQGVTHPNPDYLYPNLFYQGVTRVREELAIIVVHAPDLFEKIVSIVQQKQEDSHTK